MVTYLVTGGCGFVGSHLCEALLKQGIGVHILDDLSSGLVENAPAGAALWQGSVSDPEMVEAAMNGTSGCFHLAAVASVERSTQDWFGAHRTNLSGTIAVFNAARKFSQKRPFPVIYASSAAIYGDCQELPIRESELPRPQSPYGADKWGCEIHGRIASETYGVPTVGLRFFNVYGPRQDPASPYSGVISIFCDQSLRRKQLQVYGDGTQSRDFIFIGDVVLAMLAAMKRAEHVSPPSAGIYNVCTGSRTTVLALAHLIGQLCGWTPEICFRSQRRGDIAHSCGDPGLMQRDLGVASRVELPEGLSHTLSWMRNGQCSAVAPEH